MRLMGWKDRSILDRYAADMQVQRAIEAKRKRGQIYLSRLTPTDPASRR
jgi:hypothetical protein